MNPIRPLTSMARAMLATLDIRVERLSRHPARTLLGLSKAPIRHVIDVGANCGQFATEALRLFPQATVHSFEPLPTAYAELSRLASTVGGRLRAHNLALGAESGKSVMYYHSQHSASSSLLQTTESCLKRFPQTKTQESIEVEVRRLDDVWTEAAGDGGLLVKMDVQGSENAVIAGGPRTIALADAVIVEVCLEKLYEDAPSFEDICGSLSRTGHRFGGTIEQVTGADGGVIFIDALFVKK